VRGGNLEIFLPNTLHIEMALAEAKGALSGSPVSETSERLQVHAKALAALAITRLLSQDDPWHRQPRP
jgi:hypothetical protein